MICFCSHQPTNEVGKQCFSQWYPSVFDLDLVRFDCAEQYMMYAKAILFKDEISAELIMKADSPKEMKNLGRGVSNFNIDIWNSNAKDIVYQGNLAKFSQNPELKEYLLSTGDIPLVESAHYDKVWGTGLSEADTLATPKDKWPGTNWLGETLMKVREELNGNV